MVSHGNVSLLFSRTLRLLFGGNNLWFEHDGAAMAQRKDCANQSKRLHATATFAFEQFLHLFFSLDWDRIHSSEKEKQQNPKSWVQVVCVLFLAVSGMLLFASCQNGRPNIILQVFPCLGLWSGAVHILQHGSKGTDIRVLPTCLIFGMVFGWQMFLILWEKAPQECFWLGDTQGSSSE